MLLLQALSLCALVIYYAIRYSKTNADPDWAMFNLAAFTGSWYGRDFVDCKTPAIHLWYYALAKIVGADVRKIKFAHHTIIGMACIPILLLGNFQMALAYLVLVNAGFLYAFHGNVGQQPAAFITIALLVDDPWLKGLLWLLALMFEPKLVVAFMVVVFTQTLWLQAAVMAFVGAVAALSLRHFYPVVWGWLVEANITIPSRMAKARKSIWKILLTMSYSGTMMLYFLPWFVAGLMSGMGWLYWLPVAAYVALIYSGLAVRPNHLIPIIPWIAVSGIALPVVVALVLIDWVSANFYMGDLWERFYPGIAKINREAEWCGMYLRDKPGSLWVSHIHTAIHIYSGKPIEYGMAEQIEIREVATERRKEMVKKWKRNPAKWVVSGPDSQLQFEPKGYNKVARTTDYEVWRLKDGSL